MIPVLSQLLSDNESLLEYERLGSSPGCVKLDSICRRLIAKERLLNPQKPDMYYEGLYSMYLSNYNSFGELIWKLPYDLGGYYFTKIGNQMYVKAERFDQWMNLIAQIPPLMVIAASFLDDFYIGMLRNPKEFFDFVNRRLLPFRYTAQLRPYIPDLDYIVKEECGLHDLHIHLNGTTETDVIWDYMLKHVHETVTEYQKVFDNSAVRKLSEQIIEDFTPETLLNRLRDANDLRDKMLQRIAMRILPGIPGNCPDIALCNLWGETKNAAPWGELIDELILYLLVLSQIRNEQDDFLAKWFHHYLLIKGLIHRFVVMQSTQSSFPQFQIMTENPFRNGVEKWYERRFLQLSSCGPIGYVSMIEGRFSPKGSMLDNIHIVTNILNGFWKAQQECEKLKDTNLSLVAHFIKKPEKQSDKKFFIRHRLLRKDLQKRAFALNKFKQNHKLGKYIVGIDAAANEMDAGPEVFAPIFRYLRRNGIHHCTFHAGEDFRHLVSGLRIIWEAITFLDLQPGDRLGHCTALGISPKLWRERVGEYCFVKQGEWLDNLVFVWNLMREHNLLLSHSLDSRLESGIGELSYKIYGKNYPPFLLCKAWKLRKYDPLQYLDVDVCGLMGNINEYDSDRNEIKQEFAQQDIADLMICYHASTMFSNKSREAYDKLVQIKTCDLFTIDDLLALQHIILSKMTKERIAIEALPTSNLRISYYNQLGEYHLKRWLQTNSKDTLLPAVVLGTDDPGIFMTNIYNEYARVYLHLEECGFSTMERLNILSNLQKCSQIYKFYRK
ncbi:hypothetical protein [uncultured Bacteroides sp.]|jgi:adenosine deaminase|uniref:hypothetical protein n=1 Tax=uncultured Bacteroides sp. TaxID=162156 RepID=UPI0025F252EA|nr:hypothetical protein [uncultured Bacteroides sp.]